MARLSEHGIRLSSMSPTFLNSNSTSHTWPFSAVAELLDNASDPGVFAKQIWIDVVNDAGHLCLTFTDNGSGMTPNKLHKMLSFGFTEKGSGKASLQAIGVYGNGFKSGSMRLGRDTLIFTKNGGCQSVGMLSQTYLDNIKAQAVLVPIVPFNQLTKSLVVTEDSEASLAAILQHSYVNSMEQIHAHFDSIPSKKGTKIIIWNIRRAKDGNTEIDFDTDPSDFRLPGIQIEELQKSLRNSGSLRAEQNIPDMHYSLRAYISILYLKPRMQVILRGKKVLAKLVSKKLTYVEHDVYKPHFSKDKVKVTFGLEPKNKDHYGIMMYHRNRLIKAYEKVGCQLKPSGQRAGTGVIGIIECNFLKPAHNKQDFEYTKEYRLTLCALGMKLNDYWKEVTERKAREREFQALEKDADIDDGGPMWLQCEECLKWRSVPVNYYKVIPESWHCSQNPSPRYRSCSSPEETEEAEELLTPSYQKNHKKLEHPKSRKREKSLELSEFLEQVDKHHILSRSSSDPIQSTHTPELTTTDGECCTEKNALKHDGTNTDHPTHQQTDTHTSVTDSRETQEKSSKRETVIKGKNEITKGQTLVDKATDYQRPKDEVSNAKNDINNALKTKDEHTDTLSHKRKSESPLCIVRSKRCPWEDLQPNSGIMAEELHPGSQTNHMMPLGKDKKDLSSRVEQSDTLQQSQPPSAQALTVLSRIDAPLPTKLDDPVQRLLMLEKEVKRLRSFLGLEVMKSSQGTMTTPDSSTERPRQVPASLTARREVACQTDTAESSASSSTGLAQAAVVCEPKDPAEQNRPRKEKNESQSRRRVSDSEDSRLAQENLRDIRNNVVVLLTTLLPQLDLTGISLETTDVDNILQQIIEVNSLKI
ncbi:MORC family CW-type zinc finger protein 3 [Parambassis ranga]|uniref:MORC family CW-type zinc finger protein 3 n=1 Tax=Parambassis ranga TaxID=210632 RepID=A0A6P7J5D3_9TELE|nr:MORC family CW-type zinc finger protein 3-like [Parambassis ranga]